MGVFTYNGHSYEVDLMDIEVLKKFEDGTDQLVQNIEKIQEEQDTSASERFEGILNEIDRLLVSMFGKDVVKDLFGKKKNLRDRFHAFAALMGLKQSMVEDAKELSGLIRVNK